MFVKLGRFGYMILMPLEIRILLRARFLVWLARRSFLLYRVGGSPSPQM